MNDSKTYTMMYLLYGALIAYTALLSALPALAASLTPAIATANLARFSSRAQLLLRLEDARDRLASHPGYCYVRAARATRSLALAARLGPCPPRASLLASARSFYESPGTMELTWTDKDVTIMHHVTGGLTTRDIRALPRDARLGSNALNVPPGVQMTGQDAGSPFGYLPPPAPADANSWMNWANNAYRNMRAWWQTAAPNSADEFRRQLPTGNSVTVTDATVTPAPISEHLAEHPDDIWRITASQHNALNALREANIGMRDGWNTAEAIAQARQQDLVAAIAAIPVGTGGTRAPPSYTDVPQWTGAIADWDNFVRNLTMYVRIRHDLLTTHDHFDALVYAALARSPTATDAFTRFRNARAVYLPPANAVAAEQRLNAALADVRTAIGLTDQAERARYALVWNHTHQSGPGGRMSWSAFRAVMLDALAKSGLGIAPPAATDMPHVAAYAHIAARADRARVQDVWKVPAQRTWREFDAAMADTDTFDSMLSVWGYSGAPTVGTTEGNMFAATMGPSTNGYTGFIGSPQIAPQQTVAPVKAEHAALTRADVQAMIDALDKKRANAKNVEVAQPPPVHVHVALPPALEHAQRVNTTIADPSRISHAATFGTSTQRAASLNACYNWWCMKPGHFARECPTPKPTGIDGPVRQWTNDSARKAYMVWVNLEAKRLEAQGRYDHGGALEYRQMGPRTVVDVSKNRVNAQAVSLNVAEKFDSNAELLGTVETSRGTWPNAAFREHCGPLDAEMRNVLDNFRAGGPGTPLTPICYRCRLHHDPGVNWAQRAAACEWDGKNA